VKNNDHLLTKKSWKILEICRELKFLWIAFWRWKSEFYRLLKEWKEQRRLNLKEGLMAKEIQKF